MSVGKAVRILLIVVLAPALLLGFQWHRYVTNKETPYDEIGIALNSRMPEPIRKWGCDRLKASFPNSLPPYGCQNPETPTSWM